MNEIEQMDEYMERLETEFTAEELNAPHMCPICGKTRFPCRNSMLECEVCGWTDNHMQELYRDKKYEDNWMSFNEAIEAYKNGKEIY